MVATVWITFDAFLIWRQYANHKRPHMVSPISAISRTTLPDLLTTDGVIKLLPNHYYDTMSMEALRYWCYVHARYGIPTVELIGWLNDLIGSRQALEIGSGHGDLAHHLGIRATDNWSQTFPDVLDYYQQTKQPVIHYAPWVEKIDAMKAVHKYKPDVVVASWVTQWCDPNLPPPAGGGSIYGVKESDLLDSGVTYILIGNQTVHAGKEIMKVPHREITLPFLRSRSAKPESDRIWIWND
jgi:hypothetical protein